MIVQIFFGVLAIWIGCLHWKRRHLRAFASKVKCGIKSYPLIGHSYMLFGSDVNSKAMEMIKAFGREAFKNGGICSCWLGPALHIIISDPYLYEYISMNALEKSDVMRFSRLLIGNGSIFAPETTLGIKRGAQKQSHLAFLKSFELHCILTSYRVLYFWKQIDSLYNLMPESVILKRTNKALNTFIDEIIQTKREAIELKKACAENEKEGKIKPFLELLMESSSNGKPYTDVELREECLVMTLAGTDTTAVGSCYTALLLARHPQIQHKVYEELRDIFKDDPTRLVSAEDLLKMKYLDAVVRETLRTYPPVPIITRKIIEPLTLPNGLTLIPGTNVVINLWAINRNPKYWGPDAEEFRPERFLEPLEHPIAFSTFSNGPRNCIGNSYAMMSTKTAIAELVRSYEILPPAELLLTPEDLKKPMDMKFQFILKDANHFKLQLKLRK